jgi:hypothetical protein
MSMPIDDIPQEHIDMIRQLASEGLPVGRIAFLTHMGERTVREVLATPVNTTERGGEAKPEPESPSER